MPRLNCFPLHYRVLGLLRSCDCLAFYTDWSPMTSQKDQNPKKYQHVYIHPSRVPLHEACIRWHLHVYNSVNLCSCPCIVRQIVSAFPLSAAYCAHKHIEQVENVLITKCCFLLLLTCRMGDHVVAKWHSSTISSSCRSQTLLTCANVRIGSDPNHKTYLPHCIVRIVFIMEYYE